jgi:hypothetical protein
VEPVSVGMAFPFSFFLPSPTKEFEIRQFSVQGKMDDFNGFFKTVRYDLLSLIRRIFRFALKLNDFVVLRMGNPFF